MSRPPGRTAARCSALVAVVVLGLAGCSSGSGSDAADEGTSPTASSSETTTSAPDPVGPTEPTAPVAVEHTDAELVAALPMTRAQRHGTKVSSQCLTIRKPCQGKVKSKVTGFASVVGGTGKAGAPISLDLLVSVGADFTPAARRTALETCPQGRLDTPAERTSPTSYTPGQRGFSKRTPLTIGTWSGATCAKDLVYLDPDGKASEQTSDFSVRLDNGFHTLTTVGRTLEEATELAEEYLGRLEPTQE